MVNEKSVDIVITITHRKTKWNWERKNYFIKE